MSAISRAVGGSADSTPTRSYHVAQSLTRVQPIPGQVMGQVSVLLEIYVATTEFA